MYYDKGLPRTYPQVSTRVLSCARSLVRIVTDATVKLHLTKGVIAHRGISLLKGPQRRARRMKPPSVMHPSRYI